MKVPEEYRLKQGLLSSTIEDGNNGVFLIPFESYVLQIVVSDGLGWEHVSVSHRHRTPNWKEMCFVKKMFWDEEDCVVQFHPPKSQYINNHPFCLHLWRPLDDHIKLPSNNLV